MSSEPTKKKRSPAGVIVLFLAGSMLYIELFMQPACSDPANSAVDAAADAPVIDSGSKVDAASTDAASDGMPPVDGSIDGSIDGAVDGAIDATILLDASVDSSIDASVDAPVDAPPDA